MGRAPKQQTIDNTDIKVNGFAENFLFNKRPENDVPFDPKLYNGSKVEIRKLEYNKVDGLPEIVDTGEYENLDQQIQDQMHLVLQFNAEAMKNPIDPDDLSYIDTTIFGSKYNIKQSLANVTQAKKEFENLPVEYRQKYDHSFTKFLNNFEKDHNDYVEKMRLQELERKTTEQVQLAKQDIKHDKQDKKANEVQNNG